MKSTKQEKIKVIVVNPPTKEESKKRIKEISESINRIFSVMEG